MKSIVFILMFILAVVLLAANWNKLTQYRWLVIVILIIGFIVGLFLTIKRPPK